MRIKAGTVLTLETGEYSDYSFTGPFQVLKEFDQAEVVLAYSATWKPKEEWEDTPDCDGFIGWLASSGYIRDLDNVMSWHVGSYGRLEPGFPVPVSDS
jgi:hypothetical protein